jgi:CBS domain-containing protein
MSGSTTKDSAHLVLGAKCAQELMTAHVVTVRETATVKEAVELLTENEISAVPVVDEAGCPVGVVSRSDIVAHDCEKVEYLAACGGDTKSAVRTHATRAARRKVHSKNAQSKLVGEIMTPVLFAVAADTPASSVVDAMLALKVHRLFVTDSADNLLGVVSAIDVLRHLRRNQGEAE